MSAYSSLILGTTGLLAYWRLGDASGNAVDSKGGFSGTVTGATQGATGLLTGDPDTAYSFDGSDYVMAPANAAFNLNTGSVEAWFKTTSTDGWIVSKHQGYLIGSVGGKAGFYDFGGSALRTSTKTINDNAIHHIVLAFESGVSNGTFIYVDGVLELTTTMTVFGVGQRLLIGGTSSDSPEQFLTGTIDEVAIYNTILSPATIAEHYELGADGPAASGPSTANRFGSGQRRHSRVIYLGSG